MEIYLISPPEEISSFNADNFEKISELIPIKYFQFRPKFQLFEKRKKFVEKFHYSFLKICKKKNIKLIINDDLEIAKDFFFNGIHLGQNDKSCSEAKRVFGKNFIVGVSCSNSYDLYKKAKEESADYVAFGPAFDTQSKNKEKIDLDIIKRFKPKLKLPFVLIGGIDHKNLLSLKSLCPNYIAIISSLWNFKEGPIESAKKFRKLLKEIKNENDR
tara:strand:- start:547 stop:1191 length:645 start_codon:yes stop_codon:yes gene_type:complete